jgi:hypothetical protein
MSAISSEITRVDLDVGRVITAESIRIDSIVVANTTASPDTVDFRDAAGDIRLTLEIPANDTEHGPNSSWVQQGLNIDAAVTGVFVTVTSSSVLGGA